MRAVDPLPVGYLVDGRYRINKIIGQGGMGRVYLANDTRLANRPVAVKEMIVGEGLEEQRAIEDFAREARILAPLSHPGIPNVIDYLVENGRHYLVMEYVPGGDLESHLEALGKGGRFPEAQVLRWSRQILEVLDFLHSQKPPIIYRDLKPGNIMIHRDGRAMLIDFGIARFLPPGGRGTQIGSVGYAPPEQYVGKVEPRSDLYALAATMHHLLTGRDPQLEPPFSFPPVRALAPEVSEATERVVMQALEKDVEKRPASARAMLEALPDPDAADASKALRPGSANLRRQAPSPGGQSRNIPAAAPESRRENLSRSPTAGRLSPVRPSQGGGPSSPRVSAPSSSSARTADLRRPKPASAGASRSAAAGPSRGAAAPGVSVTAERTSDGRHAAGVRVLARLIGRNEPIEFPLVTDSAIIGRSGGGSRVDVDLSRLKHGSDLISRRHAEIIHQGNDFFIRDLGSLNGTYIVGKGRLGRDQLYRLNDRDQVAFGKATFEFRKGDADQS